MYASYVAVLCVRFLRDLRTTLTSWRRTPHSQTGAVLSQDHDSVSRCWHLMISRARWFHHNRGNILVSHELIERRDVGLHDLCKLRKLRIDLRD